MKTPSTSTTGDPPVLKTRRSVKLGPVLEGDPDWQPIRVCRFRTVGWRIFTHPFCAPFLLGIFVFFRLSQVQVVLCRNLRQEFGKIDFARVTLYPYYVPECAISAFGWHYGSGKCTTQNLDNFGDEPLDFAVFGIWGMWNTTWLILGGMQNPHKFRKTPTSRVQKSKPPMIPNVFHPSHLFVGTLRNQVAIPLSRMSRRWNVLVLGDLNWNWWPFVKAMECSSATVLFFLATLISCENQGEEARKGLGICCLVIFWIRGTRGMKITMKKTSLFGRIILDISIHQTSKSNWCETCFFGWRSLQLT